MTTTPEIREAPALEISPFDVEMEYLQDEAEDDEIAAELQACDLCPVIHDDHVPGLWAYWDLWSEWADNLAMA